MKSKKQFFNRKKKNGTLKSLNTKVNKIIRSVEIKEKYLLSALTLRAASALLFEFTGMARGTANGQRVGEKIKMKSIDLHVRLQINDALLDGTDTSVAWTLAHSFTQTRILLFIDRQNNASTTQAVNELLIDNASFDENITSVYNESFVGTFRNKGRYKILYDRVHYLSQRTIQDKVIKINKSLGQIVRYNTGSAGIGADIIDNNLKMVLINNTGLVTTAVSANLRYEDV